MHKIIIVRIYYVFFCLLLSNFLRIITNIT